MFSLPSGESGCALLCASISCERRKAHAIPAGPPPTMTTSAGICGRSMPSRGLRKTMDMAASLGSGPVGSIVADSTRCRVLHFLMPGYGAGPLCYQLVIDKVAFLFRQQNASAWIALHVQAPALA